MPLVVFSEGIITLKLTSKAISIENMNPIYEIRRSIMISHINFTLESDFTIGKFTQKEEKNPKIIIFLIKKLKLL